MLTRPSGHVLIFVLILMGCVLLGLSSLIKPLTSLLHTITKKNEGAQAALAAEAGLHFAMVHYPATGHYGEQSPLHFELERNFVILSTGSSPQYLVEVTGYAKTLTRHLRVVRLSETNTWRYLQR